MALLRSLVRCLNGGRGGREPGRKLFGVSVWTRGGIWEVNWGSRGVDEPSDYEEGRRQGGKEDGEIGRL